jgi:aspartyl-tRNA(Asn)/glutamyl-tRNA(Gln) amidotransferase subunit A
LTLAQARARIKQFEHLNAFISVSAEAGVGSVVGVKDIVDVRGTVTTGGGILLPKTRAHDDAPVIQAMRRSGCVIVGKTNLHEWAFGASSVNPHYGAVRNPHDPTRISGGSSGGSAVAVAAGMCDWALGSDTGGSIRIPASLCGVVGFKPTHGAISTQGVIPVSTSLDTLGPIASSVRSAAIALECMIDRKGLIPLGTKDRSAFRIGIPAEWVNDLDEPTGTAWSRISSQCPEISFPAREELGAATATILFAEAAAFHREWVRDSPEKYGADVLGRLLQGMGIAAVDYIDALKAQARLRRDVEAAMDGYDAIMTPTTAIVAPFIDGPDTREPLTRFTRAFNATGQPVISIPAPVDGLPVGIQVVGHRGEEARLVEVALALELQWASLKT